MTSYREVRTLSTADAAYTAGLIDGEGTIALTRLAFEFRDRA